MPPDGSSLDGELVDQLEEVWQRIAALGAGCSPEDWHRPTEVPGWSVQDNLTHLTDVEAMLLGRPPPDHEVPGDPDHVRNDFGRRNEVFVDARRSWPGSEALDEFVEVTRARLARLRSSTPDDFGAPSWTPMGPGTVRDLLPFRIFDAWVHEQDMRRALGRPGGLDGAAAEAAMDRLVGSAGYVVGKKVAPGEGTVVVIECAPPLARTVVLRIVGGRAAVLDAVPADPTVRIRTDGETYARLACGRIDPAVALEDAAVSVEGDQDLGRRIVEALDILF